MNPKITVFEHQKLLFELKNKEEAHLHHALELYYGEYSPFYSLIRNGVQFNEHVGVLQVGKTTIEVLPKADKDGEEKWRRLLVDMLRAVWGFDVKSTGNASLSLKNNSILSLYFELFIAEMEKLLHQGLIKKYKTVEGNQNSLKGRMVFAKHLNKNVIHKERFYVKFTQYNREHIYHQILFKALKLIAHMNTSSELKSRIGNLILNFPEMPNINVSATTFERLFYDRKSISYKPAIDIAKLLLLNYHPDVTKGKHDVLALMFDMNKLWEQFVLITLKKKLRNYQISSQVNKYFWKPENGKNALMRPDIVLTAKNNIKQVIVLDTKWKNLNGYNPSPEDLRQMYVYHSYYNACKTALIYPSSEYQIQKGNYYHPEKAKELSERQCSIIQIKTENHLKLWQEKIAESLEQFCLD